MAVNNAPAAAAQHNAPQQDFEFKDRARFGFSI
jgi:hypothetical protein